MRMCCDGFQQIRENNRVRFAGKLSPSHSVPATRAGFAKGQSDQGIRPWLRGSARYDNALPLALASEMPAFSPFFL
jgi:hypothetical protein